jgi:IS4 transposase
VLFRSPLAGFQDLIMTDSTVMRLHNLLEDAFPGARTNHPKAALKMHVVMSVMGAGNNSIKVTSGRRHDSKVFTIGEWIHDRLLIFDLGAETKEYHLNMTNVPVEKLPAEDIQRVYACRWEIELLFKELKSHYRIEDLPSSKPHVVEALVYAAILTLVVSRTILRALKKKMPDKIDRLPAQRWAGIFASISQELLLLAVQPPRLTELTERLVTAMILNEAIDPNANRPTLIKSVETRRHVYRKRAA